MDAVATGKVPGKYSIPPEVFKCAQGTLIMKLLEILFWCLREGTVPQDMRNANMTVTITTAYPFSALCGHFLLKLY